MSYSLHPRCLAYQTRVRAGCLPRNTSTAKLRNVICNVNRFSAFPSLYDIITPRDTPEELHGRLPKGYPELDAVVFYLLNHAVGLVKSKCDPYEDLGDYLPLLNTYHTQLAVRSARMFFYLLMICFRESRHDKTYVDSPVGKGYINTFGKDLVDFGKTLKGKNSTEATTLIRKCKLAVPLGTFTKYLLCRFEKGSFSSGFGGKAWANVTRVLDDYVHGVISAEIMMDTAFTLSHNNGPIFNKGMFYNNHSSTLLKILDVQRGGQIPQWVGTGIAKGLGEDQSVFNSRVLSDIAPLYQECVRLLPGEMTGPVQWSTINKLGSLNTYGNSGKTNPPSLSNWGAKVMPSPECKNPPSPTVPKDCVEVPLMGHVTLNKIIKPAWRNT